MSFQIYDFEGDGVICVLPCSWMNNKGKVRYNSKKAAAYIKNGMMPYKKWTLFNVTPTSERVFDTLEKALKAEKILLEKSDIESTDLEGESAGVTFLSRGRNKRLPAKLRENQSGSDADECCEADSDDASESPGGSFDPPSMPHSPLTEPLNTDIILDDNLNDIMATVQLGSQLQVEPIPVALATKKDVADLREHIEKLISEQTKTILNKLQNCKSDQVVLNTGLKMKTVILSLRTVNDIMALEEELLSSENLAIFKNILYGFGGNNIKIIVKYIVAGVYELPLQSRINWSGREGKFAVGKLEQTKLIIETMRFRSGQGQAECDEEYRYHLQHACDRRRTADKKHTC